MILRDKKKLWLLAAPLLLLVVLKLWERTRRPPLLPGLGGPPTAIAFSMDGKTVVCASSNGLVQKWMPEMKKWRSFQKEIDYSGYQRLGGCQLRFSPDGQTLYAGGSANEWSPSIAWDVATRRRKFKFNSAKGATFDVSPDGHWAVVSTQDSVLIVDMDGKPMRRKDGFADPNGVRWLPFRTTASRVNPTCVAFSPDSKTLVVGSGQPQASLTLWSVASAQQIPTPAWSTLATSQPAPNSFSSSGTEPLSVAWSPDGQRLATIGGGKITIYDTSTPSVIDAAWPSSKFPASWRMGSNPEDRASLAWSPDGRYLFSGGDEARQWNTKDLTLVRSFKTAGPVAVSPDGKTLATASRADMGELPGVRLVPL